MKVKELIEKYIWNIFVFAVVTTFSVTLLGLVSGSTNFYGQILIYFVSPVWSFIFIVLFVYAVLER